jgi:hypothetical protein
MKAVLVAVFLQLTPAADNSGPIPQVMAAITAEFDSVEACKNAIVGLVHLGEATGFKTNAICAPKDIAKLEVEKPSRAPKPQGGTRGSAS